jgi:hypothetical protein
MGRTLSDQASSEKLPDAKTKNPRLGHIFVKLFESLSMVAKPTSRSPAVMTAIHAICKYYQKNGKWPRNPDLFDLSISNWHA